MIMEQLPQWSALVKELIKTELNRHYFKKSTHSAHASFLVVTDLTDNLQLYATKNI